MHKIGLSFDVEDWFQVGNMRGIIQSQNWDFCSNRLAIGLEFILHQLELRKVRATFFILGWIAARYPGLVRCIDEAGHEVATHGYAHTPVDVMTPESFRDDLVMSIDLLKKITRKEILGFRAPSFSIGKRNVPWAFPILRQLGIQYDSSIFPISHPDYGWKEFGSEPRSYDGVMELPMSVIHLGPLSFPSPGGGYFRLYPLALTKHLLKSQLEEKPCILYFHPWEFDPEQPSVEMPFLKSFRHYVGLDGNREKFSQILDEFSFVTLGEMASLAREAAH